MNKKIQEQNQLQHWNWSNIINTYLESICSFQSNDPTLPVCPAIERTFLLVSASHNYNIGNKSTLKQVSFLIFMVKK